MLAENLVVKGTFFFKIVSDNDYKTSYNLLNNILKSYLNKKNYKEVASNFLYEFPRLEFLLNIFQDIKTDHDLFSIFKKKKSDEENNYFNQLKKTKDSTPWRIVADIEPGKYKENNGFFIEITVEPAIYYKITQIGYPDLITEQVYSVIKYEIMDFIKGICTVLQLTIINEPKPLNEYIKTEISKKVKIYGFEKVSELLEKGRKEIELGRTEYGLIDLRSAMEIFLHDLIIKIGEKPHSQDKIEANIIILEKVGYLDGSTKGLIIKYYNGIYSILSDKTTHNREVINLFNSRLYFNLIEQTFDYFIEKIIKYKVK